MVGDGENDIKAGKAAECHTALIGNDTFDQNITVHSLQEFVSYL
jgi:D-glycero-D-manno-heptose 1,7-bisphosphate phosphatase